MIYTNKLTDWVVSPTDNGWVCGRIDENGKATSYRFLTEEWARLCKRSMERFDRYEQERKWGASVSTLAYGSQITLTGSMNSVADSLQFNMGGKSILVIDKNHQVTKLDVPAIIWMWLKTTWIPKAWKALMWGEKGKQ